MLVVSKVETEQLYIKSGGWALMTKTLNKLQRGFTIIELLIVIAIIAILAGLVLNNFQGAQAKARDTQRVTRLNAIHTKLEEYYNEANSYPAAAIVANFPGIDAKALQDPRGGNITTTIVADKATFALGVTSAAVPAPVTGSGNEFRYFTYPTGCTSAYTAGNPGTYAGVACTGYELRSFIEKPTTTTTNPYDKLGLQNS
jgi:prepilin-type N-terminal cleavage/methylation domain-containing protein